MPRWIALALLAQAACWSETAFREKCIAAGNCVLSDDGGGAAGGGAAGGGAGRDDGGVPTWNEVVSELFAAPVGLDAGFRLAFVSLPTGAPGTIGGVLTRSGSVICMPYSGSSALEVLPDAGFRFIPAPPRSGGWEGGVLLDDGSVLGIPHETDSFLLIHPDDSGVRIIDAGIVAAGLLGTHFFEGAVITLSGQVLIAPSESSRVGVFDPRTEQLSLFETGVNNVVARFAGLVLLPDGESAIVIPRESMKAFVATPSGVKALANANGYSGGVLLPSGEALLTPVFQRRFLKLGSTGSAVPMGPMTSGYFSAAWSTNGYAYAIQTEAFGSGIAIIDRFGAVTEIPNASPEIQFASHYGLVGRPDGVIVGCPDQSEKVLFIVPHTRRTVSLRTMTSPWLNKW